jgi:hypothetical protein
LIKTSEKKKKKKFKRNHISTQFEQNCVCFAKIYKTIEFFYKKKIFKQLLIKICKQKGKKKKKKYFQRKK